MSEIVNATNEKITTICSTEVAEMMDMEHKNLLRKIDEINKVFDSSKLSYEIYWVENTYENRGKQYRCFDVSKKGCEFLVHKSVGSNGVIFTHRYMERFEQMEKQLSNPFQGLSKELQAIFSIDKKQQEIEVKVDKLYKTMTIDYSQQEELRMIVNRTVVEILDGKESAAYKKLKNRMFQDLWRSYKKHFRVNSYRNTAIKDFEDAVNYIENWNPNEVLMYAIQGLNGQISFE